MCQVALGSWPEVGGQSPGAALGRGPHVCGDTPLILSAPCFRSQDGPGQCGWKHAAVTLQVSGALSGWWGRQAVGSRGAPRPCCCRVPTSPVRSPSLVWSEAVRVALGGPSAVTALGPGRVQGPRATVSQFCVQCHCAGRAFDIMACFRLKSLSSSSRQST